MNKRVVALQALFALSGFCGLIYESIWSHYLKLFVGHAAYAQSLVLAVFMGGMGLGAWLVSRATERIPNLLWAYALVEAAVGIIALAFHSGFAGIIDWAYTSLLPATCAAEDLCATQWLLAAAMILPQSVLLGATFPLMTGGVLRLAPASPGRTVALLYFLNSAGAVAGVLASGFVLIPAVGLPGALLTAGLGNIAVALAVYFAGKGGSPTPVAREPREAPLVGPARSGLPGLLLAVSLLTGLSSFIYEIVWIRMLSMVMGSATHSFEIMLASFILGLALGGWWIRHRIDRLGDVVVALAVVQLAMGVCALLTLPLYNHTFDAMAWLISGLSRGEAGYTLFTLSLTVVSLAVMLPATFCAGMTLPLITYQLYRGGSGERAIGQVYAANTVGAILGVVLAVHLLMPLMGLKLALMLGAAIDIALGAWLLLSRRENAGWRRPRVVSLLVASVLLLAVSPAIFTFDPLRMGSGVFRGGRASLPPSTEVAFARDGKTATVQVARLPDGTVSLSTNGKSDGSVQMVPGRPQSADEATMVLLGALPLVHRPDAKTAAVIGFGTGLSSATLLGAPALEQLDTIEIEPAMVEGARLFAPLNDRAYNDPRHRIVLDDAKSHFARGRRRYDVIVSEPSNPWVSGVSGLFTQEFYARARQHLNEGGVLVQWLQLYEITPSLVASVFTALARSFPAYEVYVGAPGDLIIVASPGGRLPTRSAAVFEMPAVKAKLGRIGIHSDAHLSLQYVSSHRVLAPLMAGVGPQPNSDYFPIVDLQGPKARFQGSNALVFTTLHMIEMPTLRALDGQPRTGLAEHMPAANPVVQERREPYERARALADFVQHGRWPEPKERLSDAESAIALRHRLITCEGRHRDDMGWDHVLRLAAQTIPYLQKSEGVRLWSGVQASPCASAMAPWQRRWLDLLVAVAAERWTAAGSMAEALLGEADAGGAGSPGASAVPVSALQRAVLAQVAATAKLVDGRPAEALKMLNEQVSRLPADERAKPWVSLLRSQAAIPAAAGSARRD